MAKSMYEGLFEGIKTRTVEMKLLAETYEQAVELAEVNGWPPEEALLTIFAHGLAQLRADAAAAGDNGDEDLLRRRPDAVGGHVRRNEVPHLHPDGGEPADEDGPVGLPAGASGSCAPGGATENGTGRVETISAYGALSGRRAGDCPRLISTQAFNGHTAGSKQPAFPSMSLNEYQKTGLEVTLRLLEITLDDIDAILERDRDGTLYAVRTRILPERTAELSRLSTEARTLLADLARRYHLEKQERDGARIISGLLSARWEALEDTRPQKMRRYGPVDPELVPELGPAMERLIDLVLAMERLTR